MPQPVILETPRLLLREMLPEDAPFFFDLNADPLVIRYTGDKAFNNLQEALDITHYVIRQYRENGYGRLMVLEKESGLPLGWCGLKYHHDTQETDLGYRFFQTYWGKGYATEASKACVQHGFRDLNLNRIIAQAMIENTASIAVMKKTGMSFLEESLINGIPSCTYQILKGN